MNPIRTRRLILRRWQKTDLEPFAELNADPEVMARMPSALDHDQSAEMIESMEHHFEVHGFGLWAVELPAEATCIGFVGLARPTFQAHFTPCVEVGWRLARTAWGRGYASEGAAAALAFGFGQAGLDEIVSFTTPANLRSQGVMRKIGMRRTPADDFLHPRLGLGHPLREHVLYRLARPDWERRCGQPDA